MCCIFIKLQYRITKTLKLSIKVAGVNLAVNPEGPVLLPSSSKTTLQCTLAFVLSPCTGMAKGNYCVISITGCSLQQIDAL